MRERAAQCGGQSRAAWNCTNARHGNQPGCKRGEVCSLGHHPGHCYWTAAACFSCRLASLAAAVTAAGAARCDARPNDETIWQWVKAAHAVQKGCGSGTGRKSWVGRSGWRRRGVGGQPWQISRKLHGCPGAPARTVGNWQGSQATESTHLGCQSRGSWRAVWQSRPSLARAELEGTIQGKLLSGRGDHTTTLLLPPARGPAACGSYRLSSALKLWRITA